MTQPPAEPPTEPPAEPQQPGGAVPPPYGQPAPPPYGQPAPPPYGSQPPAYPSPGQPYPSQPYPQQAYPQHAYPQQPPSGYPPGAFGAGQPGQPGQPVGWVPPHPQANTALILGIVAISGFVLCGVTLLVGPFAWVLGARVRREISAEPQRYGGNGEATTGMVCGIVATAALVLGLLIILFLIGVPVLLAT